MKPIRGKITFLLAFAGLTTALWAHSPTNFREKIPHPTFTENKGQVRGSDGSVRPDVLFLSKSGDMQIFLLKGGLAYQFTKVHPTEDASAKVRIESFRIDMQLMGMNERARISKEGERGDIENHSRFSVYDVRHFTRITYHDVYPGIDWVVSARQNQIKYDFVVHPGADPSLIRMKYLYHDRLSLTENEGLEISCRMGTIREMRPESYASQNVVPTKFILKENEVTFAIGKYDRRETLIIDPLIQWSTYFGGTGVDRCTSVAGDGNGNIYVAGSSESTNNIASGGYQNNLAGDLDTYLAKFNVSGTLLWSTYYGGSGNDAGTGCAVDGSGNVFLYGQTQSTAGIATNQTPYKGNRDCFLAKFDSQGNRLWARYYGGAGLEYSGECATDAAGNVYICGSTSSNNSISSGIVHQGSLNGNSDAFLAKFNGVGTLIWGTYYGGQTDDFGYACCLDPSGNVFLCGETNSSTYIASGGHQTTIGGLMDGFLAKFNSDGVRAWATYYGGSGNENGYACGTDSQGNVFLAGKTSSGDKISSGDAHQNFYGGTFDAYVVKFGATGNRWWGTYIGGSGTDAVYCCVSEGSDNIIVAGTSVWKFNAYGTKIWEFGNLVPATFYSCSMITTDKLVLCGETTASIQAVTGGHQSSFGGNTDGIIACLVPCVAPPQPGAIEGPTLVCGVEADAAYQISPMPEANSYQWTIPGAWLGNSTTNSIAVQVNGEGDISVALTGSCGTGPSRQLHVNTLAPDFMSVQRSSNVYCQSMNLVLTAYGGETYSWVGGPNTSTYVVSPNFPTTYTVYGTGKNGCVNKATIEVTPDTSTAFSYTIDGMVAYYSVRNPACSDFQWDYGTGEGSNINANPIVNYETPGIYSVCLKCAGLPQSCVKCMTFNIPSKLRGGVGLTETDPEGILYFF